MINNLAKNWRVGGHRAIFEAAFKRLGGIDRILVCESVYCMLSTFSYVELSTDTSFLWQASLLKIALVCSRFC